MFGNLHAQVCKWTKNSLAMDSGYYAGRPPTPSDLNFKILEALYRGIKEDIGVDAARNFARFVNLLHDLSASAFIVAFEQCCDSGFKAISITQRKEDRTRITSHGGARDAQAFAVVAQALCGERKGEDEIRQLSREIKQAFIECYRVEIPEEERETRVESRF